MSRNSATDFDPESAIIDAELLVKYRMINRAIETLERAIDNAPRHVGLRQRLQEILIDAGRRDQAAQQCLALASLHLSAGDLQHANEMLLEAKRLDPRVSVTGQLRDVRRAEAPTPMPSASIKILAGQLSEVNLFDIIQILENSRLTGALRINSSAASGEIYFNDGQVVGAGSQGETAMKGLAHLVGAVDGTFEFEKSLSEYERTIQVNSNTALILDLLRVKDEEDAGLGSLDAF